MIYTFGTRVAFPDAVSMNQSSTPLSVTSVTEADGKSSHRVPMSQAPVCRIQPQAVGLGLERL